MLNTPVFIFRCQAFIQAQFIAISDSVLQINRIRPVYLASGAIACIKPVVLHSAEKRYRAACFKGQSAVIFKQHRALGGGFSQQFGNSVHGGCGALKLLRFLLRNSKKPHKRARDFVCDFFKPFVHKSPLMLCAYCFCFFKFIFALVPFSFCALSQAGKPPCEAAT